METITLKNLKEATKEQVFDQVAKHLLQQQRESFRENRLMCYYRGSDGLKCAAGCLIGDEEYDKSMEGMTWEGLAYEGLVPSKHLNLIICLQRVHDGFNVEDWKNELTKVAKEFEIKTNILQKKQRL